MAHKKTNKKNTSKKKGTFKRKKGEKTFVHSYHPSVARRSDVKVAMLVHFVAFWIKINYENGVYEFDGATAMYATNLTLFKVFVDLYTKDEVESMIKRARQLGFLRKEFLSSNPCDRTSYYIIIDEDILKAYGIPYNKEATQRYRQKSIMEGWIKDDLVKAKKAKFRKKKKVIKEVEKYNGTKPFPMRDAYLAKKKEMAEQGIDIEVGYRRYKDINERSAKITKQKAEERLQKKAQAQLEKQKCMISKAPPKAPSNSPAGIMDEYGEIHFETDENGFVIITDEDRAGIPRKIDYSDEVYKPLSGYEKIVGRVAQQIKFVNGGLNDEKDYMQMLNDVGDTYKQYLANKDNKAPLREVMRIMLQYSSDVGFLGGVGDLLNKYTPKEDWDAVMEDYSDFLVFTFGFKPIPPNIAEKDERCIKLGNFYFRRISEKNLEKSA